MKTNITTILPKSFLLILLLVVGSCKKPTAQDVYSNAIKVIETIDQSGDLYHAEIVLKQYYMLKKITKKEFVLYKLGIKQRRAKAVDALADTKTKIKVGHYPMANFKYFFQQGYICDVLKLDKEALASYNKAISLKSTNSFAQVKRGLVWERMGNLAKAKENIQKGYELSPRDPFANFHLGYYLIRHGESKKVKKYIKNLLDKWPHFSATLSVLLKEKVKQHG